MHNDGGPGAAAAVRSVSATKEQWHSVVGRAGARVDARPATIRARIVERRSGYDRRKLSARTFLQGGLTPRRKTGGRRRSDTAVLVDWHEPHLMFLAVAILLLSVADAFLTLTLLAAGAYEVNPLMNYVLERQPELFATVKMALTGTGVLALVACARATVFRVIRVSLVLRCCLFGYAALIAYECWLLQQVV